MRVGIFADKLNIDRGGSNFSLDLLARELTARGHTVTVITVNFGSENAFPESYPYDIIEAPVDNRTRIGDFQQIHHTFNELASNFDVYHAFNPALLPIAGWFRKRHDVPVVGRLNNYDIFCTNLRMMDGECHTNCTLRKKISHSDSPSIQTFLGIPKYAFDTAVLPSAMNQIDRLFALSPQVQSIYEGIGVRTDRFRVIPNFYDPSFSQDPGAEDLFSAELTILYVGNLREHKGVELLIESARELPEGVGVEIVGTGPARESLEALATRIDVDDVVTFHGWVDHDKLPAYYNEADVFVHPGHWPEPFNRTLLEAMQYDCPLVVSEIGAPPWVVADCGLSFDRGSADDLRRQLTSITTDNELRESLQQNCADRLSEFTPDRVISMIESQYEELAET
jgi:glycosyltransferase involved in cell wall biosynthesis